jgi:hypothetical protein
VAVELMVVDLACSVERHQGGDVEVAGQQQKKLVVRAERGQETKGTFGSNLCGCWDGRERYRVSCGSRKADVVKPGSEFGAANRLRTQHIVCFVIG